MAKKDPTVVNFASVRKFEYPDFLDIQVKSFKDFFQIETNPDNRLDEGLYKVFKENFPITDARNNFELEFLDYYIDPPRYSIEECIERGLTYSVPLKAKMKLSCKDPENEDFQTLEQHVYLGMIPYMTPKGTFVINGAERVVVSQLHRSPGVFFGTQFHSNGTQLYSARIIPFKGSWMEFTTDINNVMYAYIDRKKKLPITTLLRAIGYESDKDILDIFELAEEVKVSRNNLKKVLGKQLAARVVETWTEDFVDEDTGEVVSMERTDVVIERDVELTEENIEQILNLDIKSILIKSEDKDGIDYSVIYNTLKKDTANNAKEACEYIYRQLRNAEPPDEETARSIIEKLFFSEKRYDLGDVGRYRINTKLNLSVPDNVRVLTKEDITSIIKYLVELINQKAEVDDIDHLSNRRIRTVGEQLSNQFGVGLARMSRTIRERMNVRDNEVFTPTELINAKTLSSVINSFFGTNQLSQFMDQTNPLAELTHKRRMSALGPGGLSRERASFDVRDVHYSHYGRLCPIETPEGPNIGLISYLASYARANEYGFLVAPYRKVEKGTCRLTDQVEYMTADQEDQYIVAQASEPVDENGVFINKRITCRHRNDTVEVNREEVDYVDVSPKMMISIATAMIPFLENDDANRALMGANMQRQAVPLMTTQAPIVATGIEHKCAVDSGVCVLAEGDGVVTRVDANYITVRYDAGEVKDYKLIKFARSNQGTCINQRPIVSAGDRVCAGDVIADGPSTSNGEIALGKNILVGYMNWEGYNYEDAILLNERLVMEDVFTSIHVEEYECDARDTKLGPEEITRDIPGVGDDALKYLDERGIIMVGAEVTAGDILVGKVTPKGETDLTAEERLLRAIFGEKAREVRDTSLKVPHGESGIIVDVKVFTRENGDEMNPGVNQVVRVYIAQKRKISVGDKMAGRHGNKGVVSRILPREDMPYLPDGTPLDIVLNPLGVPSRMNIGQVLEVHLGYAAQALGWKVATPTFNGANENTIRDTLKLAGLREDGKSEMYDGRTGEKFDNDVTVGWVYFLKLHHLVDDKIHARSTGPYSLVTQQPLGGKAQFGGQRFGEMEVWALEAYGAAYTLQEILTVKSDDVTGRVKTYEAIVKGNNIPQPGVPESFKVLVKELQSLCLNVRVLDEQGEEIELKDDDDDDFIPEMKDELYAADDSEIEAGGYSIEDVPEDELGADFGMDFDNEEEDL